MLESEAVKEVRLESYLSGENLAGARDVRLDHRGSTGSGSSGGSVSGGAVGTCFMAFSDICKSWLVTFYRLRHNRKIGKNSNIIYVRRNRMKHELIIKKCNILRNSKRRLETS